MSEKRGASIRKSFTLSELDLLIIKLVVSKCGFLSASEALRAMIKYFADTAPCMKTAKLNEGRDAIEDRIIKGR